MAIDDLTAGDLALEAWSFRRWAAIVQEVKKFQAVFNKCKAK